jgi:copper oxidase (laccase) domain-containing protein
MRWASLMGWRGLAAGVLEATVAALRDVGASADNLSHGLALRSVTRFEVGADARSVLRRVPRHRPASRPMARQVARRSLWARAARPCAAESAGGAAATARTDAARFLVSSRARHGADGHRRLACR